MPGIRGGKPIRAVETIKNYGVLSSNILSLPRGRIDLIPDDYEIVDKTITVPTRLPDPTLELRPDQRIIAEAANTDCFINALPGWGKTFTALYIAYMLRQKALVVTHTGILKDQWVKEAELLFGITPAIISAGKMNLDSPLVIGNIQTVTKFHSELAKEFGLLIVDEAHHMPAETFSRVIQASYAKYRIGLSGTMVRKDGKHVLIRDAFGDKLFVPEQANTINPKVKLVRTGIRLTPGATWATKINNLLYDPDYQDYIATLAAIQISKGHTVLIIADRIGFLENVQNRLGETCLLVTGETPFEDRERAKEKILSGEATSIAGIRQIFSEGVSINKLSCVILAGPIANEALLEQIIGRIMRQYPNKPTPEVLDIQLNGATERRQNNLRLSFYMEKGWEVESY